MGLWSHAQENAESASARNGLRRGERSTSNRILKSLLHHTDATIKLILWVAKVVIEQCIVSPRAGRRSAMTLAALAASTKPRAKRLMRRGRRCRSKVAEN